MKYLVAAAVLAFIVSPNAAAAEIVTDRPDVAESSRTVGQTRLQVETGVDTTEFSAFTFPTKVRFGLVDPLELHVESGIVTVSEAGTSVADIDVGGKYHIFEAGRLSVGLLTAVTIPIESESVLLRPTGAVDIDLGRFGIGMNFGVDVVLTERDVVRDVLRFAAAFGLEIAGGLGAFVEVFGDVPLGSAAVLSFDGGFTYGINETNQLDLYVRVENVTEDVLLGAGAGYSVKF